MDLAENLSNARLDSIAVKGTLHSENDFIFWSALKENITVLEFFPNYTY